MSIPPRRPGSPARLLLPLLLVVPLAVPIGCGDGTVRGAGSIDIPEDKLPRFPMTRPDFKATKAKGKANPSRSR